MNQDFNNLNETSNNIQSNNIVFNNQNINNTVFQQVNDNK